MPFKAIYTYKHFQLIAVLFFLSYIFLMWGNGMLSLTHPDEVFYIESAKEMLAKHSWDTPYIFDAPQFEKPILSYWLFMIAIKIFGLNAFAGRFAPALFGMLAVLVIYGISWSMFKSKRLSFLAGLILMSSFMHLGLSRAVLTDMIFAVWVVMSLGAFYWAYENKRFKNWGIVLAFGFSGIAILTKGLLGFCFPAGTILLFLLIKKDLGFLKNLSVLWGLALLLAIALPWHILMVKHYGTSFIHEYWQNVHVRRVFEAEHAKSNTWYFYPLTMVGGVMPWTVFLFPAFAVVLREWKEKGRDSQALLFLACWIVGILLFTQPAKSKLASYIAPVFPAWVVIIAYYLDKVLASSKAASLSVGFKRAAYGLTLILMGGVIALFVASAKFKQYIPSYAPVFLLGFFLLAILLLIIFNLRKNNYRGVIIIVPGITFGLLIAAFVAIPFVEPWASCKDITEKLKSVDYTNSTILTSKHYVRGIRFFAERPVAVMDIAGGPFFSPHPIPFLDTDFKVQNFLRMQPVTFCIIKKSSVKDLERIAEKGQFIFTLLYHSHGQYIIKIESKASAG